MKELLLSIIKLPEGHELLVEVESLSFRGFGGLGRIKTGLLVTVPIAVSVMSPLRQVCVLGAMGMKSFFCL